MKRRFPILFIPILLITGLLASTALATEYPLTVVDELGREVTLEAQPKRIVSMIPSHTEALCAIGACGKLVGVDDYSDDPAEVSGLPKLGGGLTGADVEGIVALEPDLVFVSTYGELAGTLMQAGLTVYTGMPESYAETFHYFELLGRIVNREAQAKALIERVQRELAAVDATLEGLERPTVYYEIDATPYSVGPGSFIGTHITKAGGANIIPQEMGAFPRVDPEFVIAADPEVIIVNGSSAEALAERPGWSGISAVENDRVIAITLEQADLISVPGPRLADAVRFLAELFHPEAF